MKSYQDILESYRATRDRHEREREAKKQSIYAHIPELKAIDDTMCRSSLDLAKLLLRTSEDAQSQIEALQAQLNSLRTRKAVLLTDHNYAHDHLEIEYTCSKCKDTGFLEDGSQCTCFKQKLITSAYAMSNLQRQMETQNFDAFRLDLFSDAVSDASGRTQRQNMTSIYADAQYFVAQFPAVENLFLYGSSGLGKTFLCSCIAKALLDEGFSVIYQTPFGIIDILEKKTFTDKGNPFIEMAYRQLFDTDLLILDDLGTETPNTFTISEFYNILNARIVADKRTIISTNLKLSELSNFYNDRIDSRIKGHYALIKFFGPDIRWER